MMKAKVNQMLLLVSLGLNVALAFGMSARIRSPVSPLLPSKLLAPARPASEAVPEVPAVAVAAPDSLTPWDRIATKDLEMLLANLRAVGCPESTISAIVLSELRAHCLAAWRETYRVPFWSGWADLAGMGRQQREQRQELAAQANALAKRLLGRGWHAATELEWDGGERFSPMEDRVQAWLCAGPMPEDTFERLQTIRADTEAKWRNALGDRSPASQKHLTDQLRTALRTLLPPAQLEEFLARQSAASQSEQVDCRAESPAELRSIHVLASRHLDPLGEWWNPSGRVRETDGKAAAAFETELAALLGTQRTAARRAEQEELQARIAATVSTDELDSRSMMPEIRRRSREAFELKRTAQLAGYQLQRDDLLDPAERRQRMGAMAAESELKIRALLGDAEFNQHRYLFQFSPRELYYHD
jgi:hypothetical protein